jgi:hypothetical protein
MSDTPAAIGWLIAAFGMAVHVTGTLLGFWPSDHVSTWSVPLVGFVLMMLGSLGE